jgi:hypothetical protein
VGGVRKKFGNNYPQEEPEVEKVPLSSLRSRRRGRHHELMQQVLKELTQLSSDSALKVPLGNFSAKDIRSAVFRVAASQNVEISSTSDDNSLYVWKRRG